MPRVSITFDLSYYEERELFERTQREFQRFLGGRRMGRSIVEGNRAVIEVSLPPTVSFGLHDLAMAEPQPIRSARSRHTSGGSMDVVGIDPGISTVSAARPSRPDALRDYLSGFNLEEDLYRASPAVEAGLRMHRRLERKMVHDTSWADEKPKYPIIPKPESPKPKNRFDLMDDDEVV